MHAGTHSMVKEIRKRASGYWGDRIASQLEYAVQCSKVSGYKFDGLIGNLTKFLAEKLRQDSAITQIAALEAEALLSVMSPEAKKYTMICAAHAHIDMNWMWGWDETVAVTLDTMRTMLDLLEEYPQYTFSQSQASIYRIIEQYAPEMLKEIQRRVKEGRWEITASHWVEADKNMPNGESLARHILYTKKYLSALFDISPDQLNLDFEPDTFGHSVHVPEILASGGVKYYYHCRGYDGHNIYKWVAPSGSSVLVYREPIWYNAEIDSKMALYVPEFCSKYGIDTMLKVYGVGDHGGGPTRRDVERIIDMSAWPVFPAIRFGTFGEYFDLLSRASDNFPVVEGELNFVFTGCYTSQSRIKKANRIGEAALNEAEAYGAAAAAVGHNIPDSMLEQAWENVLFNQFHDIIPGSGVTETREYAMGLFQQTMAAAGSVRSQSLRAISANIDTSALVELEDGNDSVSQGAGAGFGAKQFMTTHVHRGRGKSRVFHAFNPSARDRAEVTDITLWDWGGNVEAIVVKDSRGNTVKHQVLDRGFNHYWGHNFLRLLIEANVPALGYETFILSEEESFIATPFPQDSRVEHPDSYILENGALKVTFQTTTAEIVSIIDKASGEELVSPDRPTGIFRFIEEDVNKGMTSWIVGRYMSITYLTDRVKVRNYENGPNLLRKSLRYEVEFGQSKLEVVVSLEGDRPSLHFQVECDWREFGRPGERIPQLNFHMPLGYACKQYKYDVPFGTVFREPVDLDVPGNSWALAVREGEGKAVAIVTDSKYGFRGVNNELNVTLIRGSYDPDPYPEVGRHSFKLNVCFINSTNDKEIIDSAYDFNHPFSVISDRPHAGTLPPKNSFFELEQGRAAVSSVKAARRNGKNGFIIRLYETEGTETEVSLRIPIEIKRAVFVDLNEKEIGDIQTFEGNRVTFAVRPYRVCTIYVEGN